MYEKVNPSHPDKVADRIAGAIVDLAYAKQDNPRVAVEVLIGHGVCHIINETSCHITTEEVNDIVKRIVGDNIFVDYAEVPQDTHLSTNQIDGVKCGDNGIFKGVPITKEQRKLTRIVKKIYQDYAYDGKYIICEGVLLGCQSHCDYIKGFDKFNPLGYWTGGIDVDSGATNRKLGSDMGDAVTGGGLHGKDLSKADVSVNILCHLLAQKNNCVVTACCSIGGEHVAIFIDDETFTLPFNTIVKTARKYIKKIGGFEKLAEWGLLR